MTNKRQIKKCKKVISFLRIQQMLFVNDKYVCIGILDLKYNSERYRVGMVCRCGPLPFTSFQFVAKSRLQTCIVLRVTTRF